MIRRNIIWCGMGTNFLDWLVSCLLVKKRGYLASCDFGDYDIPNLRSVMSNFVNY